MLKLKKKNPFINRIDIYKFEKKSQNHLQILESKNIKSKREEMFIHPTYRVQPISKIVDQITEKGIKRSKNIDGNIRVTNFSGLA